MKKLRISQIQFQAKSTPDENAKLLETNFLKTMGWGQLSKHVEAVADNEKGGADVLNQSLRDGLAKLNTKPLYMLRVEDFNTSGLFGYEKENVYFPERPISSEMINLFLSKK